MLHRVAIIATALLSGFAGDRVAAQETIGTVSRIQGEASGKPWWRYPGTRPQLVHYSQRVRVDRCRGAA